MNGNQQNLTTRATLEQKLRSATSAWDRLPLLLELTQESTADDSHYRLQRAQEGLRLARELNDKFWIARSLRAMASALTLTSRYSEILHYLEKASDIFLQLNETTMKAQTDLSVAQTYMRMGEIEEAMKRLLPCFHVIKLTGDPYWVAVGFRVLGDAHKLVGDHAKAIRYYRKAIAVTLRALPTRADLKTELGGFYQNLAETYYQLKDIRRMKKYLFRSLALLRETGHYPIMAAALGNIATFYLISREYPRAAKYIALSQKMFRALNYPDGEAMAWTKMGEVYRYRQNTEKAILCYRKAISIVRNTENLRVQGLVHQKLGRFYVDIGEHRKGIVHLLKALSLFEQFGQAGTLYQTHWEIAQAYETVENTAKALKHIKEYQRLKDEHINSSKYLEASRAEVRARIERLAGRLKEERSANDALVREIEVKEEALLSITLNLIHRDEERRKGNAESTDAGHNNWEIFARQFHKVHHGFYPGLLKRYPSLTPTEAKVCSLIRTGLSSKEIAGVLCISKRTVDNHRARVHRKIDIPQGHSLADFIATM